MSSGNPPAATTENQQTCQHVDREREGAAWNPPVPRPNGSSLQSRTALQATMLSAASLPRPRGASSHRLQPPYALDKINYQFPDSGEGGHLRAG
jgi:hypothetical protein